MLQGGPEDARSDAAWLIACAGRAPHRLIWRGSQQLAPFNRRSPI